MLPNFNVFMEHGWIESENPETDTDVAVALKFNWYVIIDPDYDNIKDKSKIVKGYRYNNEEVSYTTFWKTLKMSVDKYEDLFICADGTEYQPAKKLFTELQDWDKSFWNQIRRFTYKEAFEVNINDLRIKAFSSINVRDMIEHLGYERIATDGVKLKQKDGELDAVFELLKVKVSDLLENSWRDEYCYCVKCWCTSTKEEHFLWVDEKYATDPITAIASTCVIQEDIIDDIIEIKRQGDLFFLKMPEDFDESRYDIQKPKRPLTKEEYVNLLVEQS